MEVSNWMLVGIGFLTLVLIIVVPVVGSLYRAQKATDKDLSKHQIHVAETYATKHDIRELGERMERQMKDGFENLKELLTNRKNKDAA
jgi:hypothetical protein